MAIVLPSTVQLTKGISRFTNPLLTPETDESEECLLPEEMALQAAVALSGLSPQSFDGTLNRFYQQGAILLKNPNVSGTSSTTKPDTEIRSQESGISSLSGRSAARRNLGPYFEMITGTKLAIQDGYNNERMLVDSLSPTLPSSPSSSSSSSSSFCANLLNDKFISTIDDNDADIDDDDDDDDDDINDDNNNKKAKNEIIYQGRDILDLYSNISKPFELRISQIGGGTKSFFENRSLFSRTAGIGLPAHLIDQCKCGYNEYSYF